MIYYVVFHAEFKYVLEFELATVVLGIIEFVIFQKVSLAVKKCPWVRYNFQWSITIEPKLMETNLEVLQARGSVFQVPRDFQLHPTIIFKKTNKKTS